VQACSELPQLQILAEVTSVEKIQKLASLVKEWKEEIGKVCFNIQLKISEIQLKMQPTTPSEVKE